MNSKVILSIVVSCLALVSASPITKLQQSHKRQVRTAVGSCPALNSGSPVYLPDAESCTVYYECNWGQAIPNVCSPGLEFNPKLHVCDFPDVAGCTASKVSKRQVRTAVGNCPALNSGSPVYLPDAESCTVYYECNWGQAIPNVCSPGLEFNPTLHVCDFPEKAGCTASKSSKKEVVVKTIVSPLSAVGTCPPRDTDVAIFLPDSEDCATFYVCSNGRPIKLVCVPGLLWNNQLETCDWDFEVDCPNSKKTKSSKKVVRSVEGTCPEVDPATPVFFPDLNSCDIYYECSNGQPIQNECSPGLEFNPKLNVCDFPDVAGCTASKASKRQVRTAVGNCPALNSGSPVYLPDAESCTVYYECNWGQAIPNVCSPGLEFNPTLHVCDFPEKAGCTASKSSQKEVVVKTIVSPLSAVGTCPPRDTDVTIFLPDSEDCAAYYVCSNGRPIKLVCVPGMLWNTQLETCDWDFEVDCPNSKKTKSSKKVARSVEGTCPEVDPATPVFFPDSNSCDIYYECSNGQPIQNECSPGLEFNPKLNVCDFPDVAGCSVNKQQKRS